MAVLALVTLSACSVGSYSQPDPESQPAPTTTAQPEPKVDEEEELVSPAPIMAAMGSLNTLSVEAVFPDDTRLISSLSAKGDCSGEVTGPSTGGGSMKFEVHGNRNMIKGDQTFWAYLDSQDGPRLKQVLGARWLLVNDKQFGTYTTYCAFGDLLSPMVAPAFDGKLTPLGEESVNGETTTRLTDDAGSTVIWVSKKTNRILRLERKGKVTVNFLTFGEAVPIDLPEGQVAVKLSDLSVG